MEQGLSIVNLTAITAANSQLGKPSGRADDADIYALPHHRGLSSRQAGGWQALGTNHPNLSFLASRWPVLSLRQTGNEHPRGLVHPALPSSIHPSTMSAHC